MHNPRRRVSRDRKPIHSHFDIHSHPRQGEEPLRVVPAGPTDDVDKSLIEIVIPVGVGLC